MLVSVVTVLHMLVFPPESTSQNTPSVHLRSVIARALESPKEYNGLHHVFITALGRISYAPVPDMKKWTRMQVTTLRCKLDAIGDPVHSVLIFRILRFGTGSAQRASRRESKGG